MSLPSTRTPTSTALRFGLLGLFVVGALLIGMFVDTERWADADLRRTVLELRLYRVIVAFLAGAALAMAGVVVQAVFRNALASPSILGVTSGASLGGTAALVAYQTLAVGAATLPFPAEMLVPVGCMAGAGLALALVLGLTRGSTDSSSFLLAGFLLSSLFLSVAAFLTSISQNSWELGRAVIAFTLGGVSGSGSRQVITVGACALIGLVAVIGWARSLDLMLTGDEEARTLGVDVNRVRRWGVVWVALLSAGAVSVGGNVAFVGLIVPHALRSLFGVSHRTLVVASFFGGGAFVVLCDWVTRVAPTQGEIPLGVVTGVVGAPLLLLMLRRKEGLLDA